MEQPVHDRGAAGVGEQLALVADEAARRRVEDEPHASAAGRAHLDHLGLALGELLHDDAGVLLVDVDDDLLDRLEQLAAGVALRAALSAATPKARNPRAAWSRSECRAAIRRGRRPPWNPSRSILAILSATLPSASRSSRSRMTRLCTLSPSVPASGESLMRKVIARVGGSIGCAGSGSVTSGAQIVCDTVASGSPAMRDDVAGGGFLDAGALEPAKGQHLGDAALLDQVAVAVEHLDHLVRLDRAGADAAGDDAAEIGIGLEDGAEHAERPVLDPRRRDVPGDEIEQRRHALVLRALGRCRHPAFLGRAVENREIELLLAGIERGKEVEDLVHDHRRPRVRTGRPC